MSILLDVANGKVLLDFWFDQKLQTTYNIRIV
jgi:hypothetical protein